MVDISVGRRTVAAGRRVPEAIATGAAFAGLGAFLLFLLQYAG